MILLLWETIYHELENLISYKTFLKAKKNIIIRKIPITKKKYWKKFNILFKVIESKLSDKNTYLIISTSINPFVANLFKSKIIFINHGWGTKKSPGNLELEDNKAFKSWIALKKNTKYVICNSDFDSTYFFKHELLSDIPDPIFIPIGHPRNDILVRRKEDKQFHRKIKKKYNLPENRKIYLFAPTHRESHLRRNKYDSQLLNRYIEELKIIDEELSKRGIFMVFRPHILSDFSKQRLNFKNILLASTNRIPNTQELLLVSDVLITDYSSIFVDYLLLERPIIFYPHDLEYYETIRGLVISFKNPIQTPGPKINKLREILELSEEDFKNYNIRKSKNFFHKYSDGKSTERFIEFLLNLED